MKWLSNVGAAYAVAKSRFITLYTCNISQQTLMLRSLKAPPISDASIVPPLSSSISAKHLREHKLNEVSEVYEQRLNINQSKTVLARRRAHIFRSFCCCSVSRGLTAWPPAQHGTALCYADRRLRATGSQPQHAYAPCRVYAASC